MTCGKCKHIHEIKIKCPCKCHDSVPYFIVDYTTTTSDGEIESFTTCSVGGCETLRL